MKLQEIVLKNQHQLRNQIVYKNFSKKIKILKEFIVLII